MNRKSNKKSHNNLFISSSLVGGSLFIFFIVFFIYMIKPQLPEDSLSSVQKLSGVQQPKSHVDSKHIDSSIEIKNIKKLHKVSDQKPYLIQLLEKVGPIKAQEELYRSGVPFTGETHLLMHVVGD